VFHKHHGSSEPLRSGTVQAEGVILEWAPSPLYRAKVRLVVGVKFDDGQKVEFTEEISDLCLPPAGNLAARLEALSQEPVPLELNVGSKIPVRYDLADRTRMSIDEPALHDAALRKHAEAVQARHARADAILEASEPVPWNHPTADG
jgi:hypothetical protein